MSLKSLLHDIDKSLPLFIRTFHPLFLKQKKANRTFLCLVPSPQLHMFVLEES